MVKYTSRLSISSTIDIFGSILQAIPQKRCTRKNIEKITRELEGLAGSTKGEKAKALKEKEESALAEAEATPAPAEIIDMLGRPSGEVLTEA